MIPKKSLQVTGSYLVNKHGEIVEDGDFPNMMMLFENHVSLLKCSHVFLAFFMSYPNKKLKHHLLSPSSCLSRLIILTTAFSVNHPTPSTPNLNHQTLPTLGGGCCLVIHDVIDGVGGLKGWTNCHRSYLPPVNSVGKIILKKSSLVYDICVSSLIMWGYDM